MSLRDRTRSESETAIFAVVDLLQQQRPKRGFQNVKKVSALKWPF